MTRVFRAAALLLIISAGAGADVGDDAPKTLGFFGKFAAEKNRNKFDGRLDCVYGDPVKGKMCPPVMEDPMANLKSRETVSKGEVGALERLAGGVYRLMYGDSEAEPEPEKKTAGATEEESALSIFSRCLDDPDDPDCRELQGRFARKVKLSQMFVIPHLFSQILSLFSSRKRVPLISGCFGPWTRS